MRFQWSIRHGASSTARSAPRLASAIGWLLSSAPSPYPRIPPSPSPGFSAAQGTLAGRDSGSGFGDRQPQTTAEENRASHSSEVPAGGRPLHSSTHGTRALHRH